MTCAKCIVGILCVCVLLAAAAKANRTNICPFLPRFTSVEKEGGDNDLSSSTDEEGKEKVHQNEFQIIKRSNVLFFVLGAGRSKVGTTASSYWPMNSTRKAIDLASEQSLGGLQAGRPQQVSVSHQRLFHCRCYTLPRRRRNSRNCCCHCSGLASHRRIRVILFFFFFFFLHFNSE